MIDVDPCVLALIVCIGQKDVNSVLMDNLLSAGLRIETS